MDGSSPEHTMIARSLKDLSRFLTSSNRGSVGTPWERANNSPRMQLSFSDGGKANMTHDMDSITETEEARSGVKRKASEQIDKTLKKHRDSVTGLDVCRLLRDKDVELVDAHANITKLKSDLSSVNSAHSKLKLDYDSELSQLRVAQLQNRETIDELQLKLKNEKKANESLRDENHRLRAANTKVQSSNQQRMASTTSQYTIQSEQLRMELSTLREVLATTEKKLKDKTSELDLCEAEVRGIREEVSGHVQQAKELRQQLMAVDTLQLQLQKEKSINKELQGRLDTVQSQEQLASSFERSVQRLPDLERQLTKLKEENDMYKACSANTRLLEEQVASATDQIALLQQRCQDATHLHAQLELAKSQMATLEEVLKVELSLTASPQPEELRRLLKGLRSDDKSLNDSISAMRDGVASHKRQMEALEKEAKDLRDSTAQQQQMSQRHVQLARRLQRKLILVSKERDSLKTILTSYEAEATMTAALAASSGRLGALEESLSQYQQELARLEQELDYYQHAPPLHGDKVQLSANDRAQMAALQEQLTQLQEQVSKLQEEKEVLEYRLEQRALQGDHDPSKVNVLHMKQNPTTEAEEQYRTELSKLEEELRQLKEQLVQQQSASKEVAADVAPAVVTVQTNEEDKQKMQELEKEVKSMEVKQQRLIEAYKSKSNEMRQLVYRLLGYNVVPSGDNCYKLSNMYAESPNDFFMFELASNGEIRLLLTDFSNSLDDLIDAYLNHENSYPAFLSAVTIDLFNRQTMVAAPSSTSPPSTLRAGSQEQDGGRSTVMEEEELRQNEDEEEDQDDDDDDGEVRQDGEGVHEEEMDSDSNDEEGREDVAGEEEEDVEEEEDEEDEEDDDDDDEDDDDEDDEGQQQQQSGQSNQHLGSGGGGPVVDDDDDDDDDDLICLD